MIGQQVTMKLRKSINDLFNPQYVKALTTKLAKKSIELMWQRNAAGVDSSGLRFGGYNYSYARLKRKLISGTMRGRGKKPSKTLARYNAMKTSNAATKVNDKLRLTGQLFEDTTYDITQFAQSKDYVSLSWRIKIKARSQAKARGLMNTTGRNRYSSYRKKAFLFLGLTKRGSLQRQEQKALTQIVSNDLKQKLKLLQMKYKSL